MMRVSTLRYSKWHSIQHTDAIYLGKNTIYSSRLAEAYISEYMKSSLVQIMTCRILRAKALSQI